MNINWTLNYPTGISRRLVDKVKESPKIARKMITKMTSPGRRHRKQIHDEEIFIVSVNVLHTSGHSGHGDTLSKKDAWWVKMLDNDQNFSFQRNFKSLDQTLHIKSNKLNHFRTSMGENIKNFTDDFDSDDSSSETDDSDDDSNDDSDSEADEWRKFV